MTLWSQEAVAPEESSRSVGSLLLAYHALAYLPISAYPLMPHFSIERGCHEIIAWSPWATPVLVPPERLYTWLFLKNLQRKM